VDEDLAGLRIEGWHARDEHHVAGAGAGGHRRAPLKANLAPSGEESDGNQQSAQIDRGHLERQASSPMGATQPGANLSQFVPS
jgi:hypothetical protein